jgi:hypothetical protein
MKKILSVLLIAALLLTLFPLTALASDPFFLEAPKNLRGELKFTDEGLPYFELKLDIPDSVKIINANLESDSGYYEGFDCDYIEIDFAEEVDWTGWKWVEALHRELVSLTTFPKATKLIK